MKERKQMNAVKKLATVSLMFAAAAVAARTTPPEDHSSHHSETSAAANADVAKAEGEVRKVDREARKLTLRHGPIPNLEMPDMTMVFRVADPKMLDGLEAKQKVRFTADRIEGQLTVTSLEVVQ
jgi:Cu(I)/Ag(I) efflux system periplasmic protein CusF